MAVYFLFAILIIIIFALIVKIIHMQKGIDDINKQLNFYLENDTNVLISTASNDKHIKNFANELGKKLKILRKQKLQYMNGDRDIKDAIMNISHDLRTPLTAILGYLDLLKQKDNNPEQTRYLQLIENRASALKKLTEELFCYSLISSEPEQLILSTVNINSVLQECIAGFYAQLDKKATRPKITMPENAVIRNLNSNALSRIFNNIIDNAIKYSDGDLNISLNENGEIIFKNTANSLSEIDVGKLFNRYFTVASAKSSTGIGLAIAKSLTEQMGGKISAELLNGNLLVRVVF